MFYLHIPRQEHAWSETEERFYAIPEMNLELEHSLISITKWEEYFHKPFLTDKEKTNEEMYYYLQCMTLNRNVDPIVYRFISDEDMQKISDYINDDHTALQFFGDMFAPKRPTRKKEQVTNELIYYYMTALQIPFSPCEKWHINRLMALIQLCNEKNKEQEAAMKGKHYRSKLSTAEQNQLAKRYHEINRQRLAEMGTRG